MSEIQDVNKSIDTLWILLSGALVFIMQLGFASVESGLVTDIWVPVIMMKNLQDCLLSIICFFTLGYAIAFSPSVGGFVGDCYHAGLLNIPSSQWGHVFFQATFASAAITIVSGCVLERMKTTAYEVLTMWVVIVQYSFVAHWVWNPNGFLKKMGFVDFAGSGVVHLTGGIVGFVLVSFLNPRRPSTIGKDIHLDMLSTGTFLFWFGWIGFNAGSVVSIVETPVLASKIAVIVLVAPSVAATVALQATHPGLWKKFLRYIPTCVSDDIYDSVREHAASTGLILPDVLNTVLCGLVAVTAGCDRMEIWGAAASGVLASCVYFAWKNMLLRLNIDEPLGATAVHGACGFLGLLNAALFDNNPKLTAAQRARNVGIQFGGACLISVWNALGTVFFVYATRLLMFRTIEVGVLTDELGLKMFRIYPKMAFYAMIEGGDKTSRRWLWYFYQFLSERATEEHIEFLLVVRKYKSQLVENEALFAQSAEMARTIWSYYIEPGCPKQVNVSASARSLCSKLYGHILFADQAFLYLPSSPTPALSTSRSNSRSTSRHSKSSTHTSRTGSRRRRRERYVSNVVDPRLELRGIFDTFVKEVESIVQGPFREFALADFVSVMIFDGWNVDENVYGITDQCEVIWVRGPGKWWSQGSFQLKSMSSLGTRSSVWN